MKKPQRPIVIGAVVLLLILIHLALNGQILKLSYARDDLRAQYSDLRRRARTLETQKAQLESLGRVEKIAREQLGMKDADKIHILTVPRDR